MNNYAIVIGNSKYENLNDLECCEEDVKAILNLLDATNKYAAIKDFINLDSSELKNKIRSFLDTVDNVNELFFYFSGHGFANNDDFYFCTTDFDSKKPNVTGLSMNDLHQLLRATNAKLVVKIIDACNSGKRLIKNEGWVFPVDKSIFNNHIQMASCLDNQNSMTGDPLSLFTQSFYEAVLAKESGEVYYTEIINWLRDEYQNDYHQIPHFVTQGTGREVFASSGEVFDKLRQEGSVISDTTEPQSSEETVIDIHELSTLAKLKYLEQNFSDKEDAQNFIKQFISKTRKSIEELSKSLDQIYTVTDQTYDYFSFEESESFITSVLAKEERSDNFVTAKVEKVDTSGNSVLSSLQVTVAQLAGNKISYRYTLELNCDLADIQLVITLNPIVKTLRQIKLCITFAPSLSTCYLFVNIFSYKMSDWDSYLTSGERQHKEWYKFSWKEHDSIDNVTQNIFQDVKNVVNDDIESAVSRVKSID